MFKDVGLTEKEAEEKLKEYGLNEIKDLSKSTPLKILFRQIKSNFIFYLLLVAMLISFFVGKTITGYTILVVILVVITTGFIQEFRSEQAISALRGMILPQSVVIRDGKKKEILSSNLVPGDIIILRTGEKIPADCVILEEKELRVNESMLTGESRDISKTSVSKKDYSDKNLVYMGSFIVNGRCVGRVIHTGMNSKFGKIAGLISKTEKELPLQNKVNSITKYMALIGFIISVVTGLIVLFRFPVINSVAIVEVLILIIALCVSAFPEAFPVVLIATLSNGAYQMAKKNAIVNRMSILETLGETTVICSDKTGTITKGEMTVNKIFAGNTFYDVSGVGYESIGDFFHNNRKINILNEFFSEHLLYNSLYCSDSHIEKKGDHDEFRIIGSPTESSLLVMAAKADVYKEDFEFNRIEEIPFNSERKMMTVVGELNNEKVVYTKGAPEYVLNHCKFILTKKGIVKLSNNEKQKILDANTSMTTKSLRTLALAYKNVKTFSKDYFEEDLVFIGLVGIEDPPRLEVKESIVTAQNAGISVKMITGDNKETAVTIAKEIGLSGKLMLGSEIDDLTDDELSKIINSIVIFARVKPEHKLRIVNALKKNGEIVTMTGDGVNDAPALKEAHVGVAMGKNGTDVSRSVADLTLKDDNFSTIVGAISEGRTIFKNIRKFITFQISCNFAELSILFFGVLLSPLFGWEVPLLVALQILFMNLVTADLPAISLGFNPPSSDVMDEKPRRNAKLITWHLLGVLAITGGIMTILVLMTYYLVFNYFGDSAILSRTVALATLIGLEIAAAFNFRSFRKGVLNGRIFINRFLVYASLISLFLTGLIIYTPLNKYFETVPLGFFYLGIVLVFTLIFVLIFDLFKHINRKNNFFDFDHM